MWSHGLTLWVLYLLSLVSSLEWISIHECWRDLWLLLLQDSVWAHHKTFGTEPTVFILPLDFLSVPLCVAKSLISSWTPGLEPPLTANTPKLLFIGIFFAFSPYVLMKKEKLPFLIPWQLFRWDHITLTQFWPISSASWIFILLSYTPFPTLNRPFLSQREKSFFIIQPPENHVIFPVCGLLQLHWDIGVFSKSKQNPLTIVLGTRTLV